MVLLFGRLSLWLHVLFLLLDHLIEFLFLVVIQSGADFGDRAFAKRVDFLDLIFARHRIILHDGHGLSMLVFQRGLDFSLLIGGEVQLLGQRLNLIVNAGVSGHLAALRLGCRAWLRGARVLRRLRRLGLGRLRRLHRSLLGLRLGCLAACRVLRECSHCEQERAGNECDPEGFHRCWVSLTCYGQFF
jgi:hypothetical protein